MKNVVVVAGVALAGLVSQGCGEPVGPELVIETLVDPQGESVRSPFLPSSAVSNVDYVIENRGDAVAEDIVLTFAELACLQHVVDEGTVPKVIEAGAQAAVTVDVTTQSSCEGLHIVDWFLTWSGRETRGTFDYNVTDG